MHFPINSDQNQPIGILQIEHCFYFSSESADITASFRKEVRADLPMLGESAKHMKVINFFVTSRADYFQLLKKRGKFLLL